MVRLELLARITVAGVALWIVAVWAAGVVYVAVTYVVARHHVPARSLSSALRSALHEFLLVALTEPLLLWFQLFGRRMRGGGGEIPIVLVHGYFQNRVDFMYLARRLRAAGAGPLYAPNFFWPQSLERSSDDIRGSIARVREKTGAEKVDLLTHSSGGLFALDIIGDSPELVRRAVLIALPGGGVPWRGPVLGTSGSQLRATSEYQARRRSDAGDVPTLSIYSAHDNVVHPASTSVISGAHASNHEVLNLGHLAVLYDRHIADEACDFLMAPDEPEANDSVAQ